MALKRPQGEDTPVIVHDLGKPLSETFSGLDLHVRVLTPVAGGKAPVIEQISIHGLQTDTLETIGRRNSPEYNAALQQFFADKASGASLRGNAAESWMLHGIAMAPGLNREPNPS